MRMLAVAACTALMGGALPISHAVASEALRRIGTLAIGDGDGLVPDATTGRLLAISGGIDALTVKAFDGKTLKQVALATYPTLWPQAGRNGRPRVQALDAQARRLYLIAYASAVTRDNLADPQLVAIDADRLTLIGTRSLLGVFGPGVRILGLQLRPGGRALILGQAIPSAAAVDAPRFTGVAVADVDLVSGGVQGTSQVVRGCQSAITNQTQSEIGAYDGRVFVGCATTQALAVPGPGVPAIAEISLTDPASQTLHFLPGSYATGDIYYDEVAQRLLPVSAAANRPAQSMWVFDLAHRSFVGQIAAGERNLLGAGVNPATGRVYVGIDDAVLVSTDRGIEVPQATAFDLRVANGAIATLPYENRIVVPAEGPNATIQYVVFSDALGANAFVPGVLADPRSLDALTTDDPQYSSDAQAFGMRIRQLGGVNAVLQNIAPLGGNYWRDPGNLTGLKDGNRDVTFAAVLRAHLGEGEASAASVAADPDSNTASDYLTIAKRVGAIPQDWPYEQAACRDFGAGAEPGTAQEATATCRFSHEVTTGASFSADSLPGIDIPAGTISVGATSSHVEIRLDPARGLVATAVAEARHVVVGTSVTIGRVVSEASATAAGKPGAAAASYRRIFENVKAGTFTCTTQCDPTAVLAAMTATLGAQVMVELPGFERAVTPGGAHAHAIREPWAHQEDVVVSSQNPTEQQVPALRIQYVNDSTLASRVILDIAATKADATRIRLVKPPAVEEPDPAPILPTPRVLPTIIVQPPVPPPTVAAPGFVDRVVRTVGHGWKVLATGRPGTVARSVALWALLASPAFFALRRRWLRRLPEGLG
jgi:hypothetical protein